jgi:hypothetical protein
MDAYDKLRPWTAIERCDCETITGLLLVDLLTDNPIHCAYCRNEIEPEHIGLTTKETESIAAWISVANALYRLWLDSGAYEQYAKTQLRDPNGQVNRDGLLIAEALSAKIPTKLWFFNDADDGEPTQCPVCCKPLDKNVKYGAGMCAACRIHI